MMSIKADRSIGIWVVAIVSIAFGLLTIKSGGLVLFVDGSDRVAAGNYVPFVLWFNFLAGFVYLVAGSGLFLQKRWGAWISVFIVVATMIVFALFGLHILNDGLYETRTVAAMSLRTVVWVSIATFSYMKVIRK